MPEGTREEGKQPEVVSQDGTPRSPPPEASKQLRYGGCVSRANDQNSLGPAVYIVRSQGSEQSMQAVLARRIHSTRHVAVCCSSARCACHRTNERWPTLLGFLCQRWLSVSAFGKKALAAPWPLSSGRRAAGMLTRGFQGETMMDQVCLAQCSIELSFWRFWRKEVLHAGCPASASVTRRRS